jgi:serine/threonine-protein kinase
MPLLNPAHRLGPYEIVGLIGAGGMGEVYTARDTRLGRLVAVKVLSGIAGDEGEQVQRFRLEAQAASALNHPNVILVHDIGEFDGVLYLVSELIDGQTLRDALAKGALSVATALDYGIQIAHGLQAAHERGVVHRDLKPENVMIARDGRVKILDFGLAKIDGPLAADRGQATLSADAIRTLPGTLLGTIAYMAPERIRAADVDPRSDLFSLGTILFEMVEGTRPFARDTAAELIAAILRDPAPPLRSAPPGLANIVHRCLEKEPEDRYQSAGDVARDLEAAAHQPQLIVTVPRAEIGGEAPGSGGRTIAVLPFANVGTDADSEYFSDGLTEELIHELSRVRGLQVVAWNSASKLKGRTDDLKGIGEQLGVASLLMGSVRKAGDRVRIVAKLIEPATGYLLWAETYDRRIEDLFAIQEEIARSIVTTLARQLQLAPVPIARQSPASIEAYNLYLKGRFFWNKRTSDGLRRSIECFDQAIAEDPTLAVAHAGIADACCLLADYGLEAPADTMPRARQAALDALTLDPRSSEAHASFALIHALYDWQWQEAEAFFRRAIELNPGYATAHHWLAIDFLSALGRFDEAREEIDIARRLDPLSLIIQEGHGYLLMLAREYDKAVVSLRGLLELDPTFYKAYTSLARAHSLQGRYAQAIELFEKGHELMGDVPSILGALGQTLALDGQADEARRMAARLDELSRERYVQSTAYALIYAGLGDHATALEYLERGFARRDLSLSSLKIHPAYDSLRAEPRFAALLRGMRMDG